MLSTYASEWNEENHTNKLTSKNKTRKSRENLIKMKELITKKELFEENEKNEPVSNTDNDGLADFTPLTEPSQVNNSTTYNQMLQNKSQNKYQNNNENINPMNSDYQDKFVENFEKLKHDKQLNIKSYENSYLPYYNKMSHNTDNMTKSDLVQKLDYIIKLLEDEQTIKTGHVTEELILYCFLGVFIIFIVDSFARTGKYKR